MAQENRIFWQAETEQDPWEAFKRDAGFNDLMNPYEDWLKSLFEARRAYFLDPSEEKKDDLIAVLRELGNYPDEFFKECKPVINNITSRFSIDHLPL